jgi:fatty-acyl-CoA synthase
VGRRLPFQPVKVIEVNAANEFVRECAPGERGVVVVSGPGVMQGYVDTRLDAEFFVKGLPGEGRWGNTGDLGAMDEDGFVWLFGRAKDLIIRGGHNIDPRLVEEVLVTHPAVQMAVAIGRPDALKGEMPMAYVVLKPGAQAAPAELVQFCRERVQERAATPVEIVIVDALPLTAVGKISKPTLRRDATARVATSVATEVVAGRGLVSVSVDDSGRRPCVLVRVETHGASAGALEAALDEALRPYPFASKIQVE